ncbi:N-succinylarginine dihydrolase [Sandaracinus amylolyticus]|uniref:N-succinylarginine dihydrolase n=1 Tax=Sandaracinus amylolyticus TaxID=927083 RepID=A0A0F6SFB9_9BACT|nr:N-succinylarginine dihydrolase [Sandaracinus amylolyticus]AKF06674.1 Succinylarginine dihydrolase [Sandaracinus amylolyticus]
MTAKATEANFDGLVGPTHNYAGLSYGNVASTSNLGGTSSPRTAALQGLAKMKALADLGIPQGILPPQERPDVHALRRLGLSGATDAQVIERAAKDAPMLLALCCSASSMWTANAATIAPSADTRDARVHFTPANLIDRPHRAIEPAQTTRTLRAIFSDESRFVVHEPLEMGQAFADEGAANHTRLVSGDHALHLFVYGRRGIGADPSAPKKFPARQTLEASQAIARLHGLDDARALFVQQSPDVIDQGVFHNDVIAVGHGQMLFFHELAFRDRDDVLRAIAARVPGFEAVEVRASEVSVEDAVKSYLFNSQILTLPGGGRILVAPEECREVAPVAKLLDRLVDEGVFSEVKVFDLRQSMRNGGGPACLRLRVVLEPEEIAAVRRTCWMNEPTYDVLVAWATKHYRDRLEPRDLADPSLLDESRRALDELTGILALGSIYPFQR